MQTAGFPPPLTVQATSPACTHASLVSPARHSPTSLQLARLDPVEGLEADTDGIIMCTVPQPLETALMVAAMTGFPFTSDPMVDTFLSNGHVQAWTA